MLASSYFLSPSWHRYLLECIYNIFPSQASPQESVPVPLTNRPPSQNIPSLNNKYPPDKKLSTWLRGLLGTLNVSGTFYDWGRFMTGDVSWRDVCLGDALYHGSYHQGTFCMYASLLECHEDFQTHRRIHFLGPSRIWIWINKKKSDSDPHQICPELRSCLLVIIVGPMWYRYIFIVVFY